MLCGFCLADLLLKKRQSFSAVNPLPFNILVIELLAFMETIVFTTAPHENIQLSLMASLLDTVTVSQCQ
jgi:hypothetical protein